MCRDSFIVVYIFLFLENVHVQLIRVCDILFNFSGGLRHPLRHRSSATHFYPFDFTFAVQFMPFIHTHIHTTTAIGCHSRYQPARQEQLGVRCLAQGHFDTPRVGSNRQPSDCQTSLLEICCDFFGEFPQANSSVSI